ncbi:MAG: hypothetical protein J1E36_05680, partial [Eubacterium sp.]|nr:hypothetical protein [Eubacterium sp.]
IGVNRAENEEKILKLIEEYDNLSDGDMKHKIIDEAIASYPTDFRLQLRKLPNRFQTSASQAR